MARTKKINTEDKKDQNVDESNSRRVSRRAPLKALENTSENSAINEGGRSNDNNPAPVSRGRKRCQSLISTDENKENEENALQSDVDSEDEDEDNSWRIFMISYVKKMIAKIEKEEKNRVDNIFRTHKLKITSSGAQDEEEERELNRMARKEFKKISGNIGTYSKTLWELMKTLMPGGKILEFPPEVNEFITISSIPYYRVHTEFFEFIKAEFKDCLPPSGIYDLYKRLMCMYDRKQFTEKYPEEFLKFEYCKLCSHFSCGLHNPQSFELPRFDPIVRDDDGPSCSNDCYKNHMSSVRGKMASLNDLEDVEHVKINREDEEDRRRFYRYLATGQYKICEANNILGNLGGKSRSCVELYKLALMREEEIRNHVRAIELEEDETREEAKERITRQKKIMKKRELIDLSNLKQGLPCNHVGSCEEAGKDCSCNSGEYPCTSLCKCGRNCSMRFPGCNCADKDRSLQCSERCYCLNNNRECDPHVCRCCSGATDEACRDILDGIIDINIKCSRLSKCTNTVVQRGVSRDLEVRRSNNPKAGRGCFLKESVKHNEYLGEYTGEIVSREELERRNKLYNGMGYSYKLNERESLDSTYFGSMLRFANNADKRSQLNVTVRNTIVNGQNRIKMFAYKSMEKGTELLSTYQYSKAQRKVHFDIDESSETCEDNE